MLCHERKIIHTISSVESKTCSENELYKKGE